MKKQQIISTLKRGSAITAAWIGAALSAAPQVYADDWLSSQTEVTVDPSSLDMNTLMSRVLTLICAIIAVGGIFTIAQGYQTWSTGRADENQANEAKGMRKMVAGIVEVAAPAVFAFLLNS